MAVNHGRAHSNVLCVTVQHNTATLQDVSAVCGVECGLGCARLYHAIKDNARSHFSDEAEDFTESGALKGV